MQGLPTCKPGAPLPFSKTLPNVLIIGDSVSIGYTPKIAADMASIAFVQHSPSVALCILVMPIGKSMCAARVRAKLSKWCVASCDKHISVHN